MGVNSRLGTWVRRVPSPDTYRVDTDNMGEWLALRVTEQIHDLERRNQSLAAFVADSLFSSDGIFAHDPGILEPVLKVVREAGGLFVADEVQCGFARTGSHMWGYQRHNIVPDIISMGKPMGNGYPVAGIVMQPNVVADFGNDIRYFNTFGGNTVAIAAANATLEVVEGENLIKNSQRVGDIMMAGLHDLMQRDGRIGDIRGAGLYMGIEMVKNRETLEPDSALALALVNEMCKRRVLISATAFNANVLKVRPPLTFSAENADQFLTELDGALKTVS